MLTQGGTHGPARALAVVGIVVCAALLAAGADAAPYTYNFSYVRISGQGNATASVTFDDSLLAPNSTTDFTCDFSAMSAFSFTVTGLPGSPSSTSFTQADLAAWIVTTATGGRLTDINFFLSAANQNCSPPKVNGDNYQLAGVDPFTIALLYVPPTGGPAVQVALFQDAGVSVPLFSLAGVAALALLIAVAGAVLARRLS